MQKIFFDSNAGTYETGYMLWFENSVHDINKIPDGSREGATVILRWSDEKETIEYTAKLKFDSEHKCWKGIPVA